MTTINILIVAAIVLALPALTGLLMWVAFKSADWVRGSDVQPKR